MPIADALSRIKAVLDLAVDPPEDNPLQFIHKRLGEVDVYFVANQQNRPFARELLFRTGEKIPEIWDPESGSVTTPAVFCYEQGRVRLPFRFGPRQSVFFVFRKGEPKDVMAAVTRDGRRIFPGAPGQTDLVPDVTRGPDGLRVSARASGEYRFSIAGTKQVLRGNFDSPEEHEIRFDGTLEFKAEYATEIESVRISSLKSLTDFDQPDIRYFSGNATYRLNFSTPSGFGSTDEWVCLDIGDFESVADVRLNGKDLGRIWRPGTRLNVTGLLKEENQLIVVVANVYRNRLIGDLIEYGSIRNLFTSAPVTDFLSKDKPLKRSGLLGPLRLIKNTVKTLPPAGDR